MVLLALNTIVCASILLPIALAKLVLPFAAVRRPVDRLLNSIATLWIRNNSRILPEVIWDVAFPDELSPDRWYLVASNHQSWADIVILQHLLTGRIPMLKFFLKRRLIWVPVIGIAWWALDFPFMKRHSKEFLERHPERRGDDLAAIRKACEKFSLIPTAVMSFIEGTRFSPEKKNAYGSPYQYLLTPKSGGIGLALNAMGERFHSLLDVTIFYPGAIPSFFELFAGRLERVVVRIRERPIPPDLTGGDYAANPEFRSRTQTWVSDLWLQKDRLLDELHLEYASHPNTRR